MEGVSERFSSGERIMEEGLRIKARNPESSRPEEEGTTSQNTSDATKEIIEEDGIIIAK
jgi:hypothetical protein